LATGNAEGVKRTGISGAACVCCEMDLPILATDPAPILAISGKNAAVEAIRGGSGWQGHGGISPPFSITHSI